MSFPETSVPAASLGHAEQHAARHAEQSVERSAWREPARVLTSYSGPETEPIWSLVRARVLTACGAREMELT